jgi:hypothetical protein
LTVPVAAMTRAPIPALLPVPPEPLVGDLARNRERLFRRGAQRDDFVTLQEHALAVGAAVLRALAAGDRDATEKPSVQDKGAALRDKNVASGDPIIVRSIAWRVRPAKLAAPGAPARPASRASASSEASAAAAPERAREAVAGSV